MCSSTLIFIWNILFFLRIRTVTYIQQIIRLLLHNNNNKFFSHSLNMKENKKENRKKRIPMYIYIELIEILSLKERT